MYYYNYNYGWIKYKIEMSKVINLILTSAGLNATFFDVYSLDSQDNLTGPLLTNVPRATLLNGIDITVPDDSVGLKVESVSEACTVEHSFYVPTTTTSTTTTSTTTTTTTINPAICCSSSFYSILPGEETTMNGINVAASTSHSGSIMRSFPGTICPACLPCGLYSQQLVPATQHSDWDYTFTFSKKVNNVKIRLFNYSSQTFNGTSSTPPTPHTVIQEGVVFTTELGDPSITTCSACYAVVADNTVKADLYWDPGFGTGVVNGSGIFEITLGGGFTELTITGTVDGTNPNNYNSSIGFDLCSFDIITPPDPPPTTTTTAGPEPTTTTTTTCAPPECQKALVLTKYSNTENSLFLLNPFTGTYDGVLSPLVGNEDCIFFGDSSLWTLDYISGVYYFRSYPIISSYPLILDGSSTLYTKTTGDMSIDTTYHPLICAGDQYIIYWDNVLNEFRIYDIVGDTISSFLSLPNGFNCEVLTNLIHNPIEDMLVCVYTDGTDTYIAQLDENTNVIDVQINVNDQIDLTENQIVGITEAMDLVTCQNKFYLLVKNSISNVVETYTVELDGDHQISLTTNQTLSNFAGITARPSCTGLLFTGTPPTPPPVATTTTTTAPPNLINFQIINSSTGSKIKSIRTIFDATETEYQNLHLSSPDFYPVYPTGGTVYATRFVPDYISNPTGTFDLSVEVEEGVITDIITVTDQAGSSTTNTVDAVGPKYYYFYDVPYDITDGDPIIITIIPD